MGCKPRRAGLYCIPAVDSLIPAFDIMLGLSSADTTSAELTLLAE